MRLSGSNSTITYTRRQAEGAQGPQGHSHMGHEAGSRGYKNGAKNAALGGSPGRVRELYDWTSPTAWTKQVVLTEGEAMAGWTPEELASIGAAHELEIAPYLGDGRLRRYTVIWVVRVADDLYVRSWKGRSSGWFSRALERHEGRIRAAGIEREVTFEEPDEAVRPAIDQAYRRKYALASTTYAQPMIDAEAAAATFRLVPR